ncbi:unnamed protein product [Ostreobium quekettii]|uniref:Uncharacterized protein n=1 Tax=Ostreobium quekettii TaxID=121088 RepID=A0A8S1J8G1_9CHLO|nr:unnamed protein product [Ostreobium quekettii]|eukprot:evm.model.scf_281.12 EVM.evm.TU.scf_281.12   scf_281:91807-95657(+)
MGRVCLSGVWPGPFMCTAALRTHLHKKHVGDFFRRFCFGICSAPVGRRTAWLGISGRGSGCGGMASAGGEDGEPPLFSFTNDATFPNKVKLRKEFDLWPVVATVGGDVDVRQPGFEPKFSVKDTILKGRFFVEPAKKTVGYRKTINAPLAGTVDLQAEVCYWGALKPKWHLQYRLGGMCKTDGGDTLKMRRKVALGEKLALEFRGHLRWPMPVAAVGRLEGQSGYRLGEERNEEGIFQFTLDEANAYINF